VHQLKSTENGHGSKNEFTDATVGDGISMMKREDSKASDSVKVSQFALSKLPDSVEFIRCADERSIGNCDNVSD